MGRRIIDRPAVEATADLGARFGQRFLLTVDTEEEFNWDAPFRASGFGLDHLSRLDRFQTFCEGQNISPVYLVDWPVATSPIAIEIIGSAVKAGKAEVGVQLHPWVNPPHEEEVTTFNSFAGNLPFALEREKFLKLRDMIETSFGVAPQIYRAGRYGLGPRTAEILHEANIPIDSSVRAKFDYSAQGGQNYMHHPVKPYWIDDAHSLLELPLTTVFWGMLRRQGQTLFPLIDGKQILPSLMSRLALLERISLTPEGVGADEAIRGIDIAVDDGLPLLVLSFHSPSIAPGHTPYVHNDDDLDALYDWWRAIYAYLHKRGVKPATVREIVQAAGM
ncbi:MAG: polysaccharide deacetylase family protein [Sphingomonadaceae bacterium]